MAQTKKKPTINFEGMEMLEKHILAPANPRVTKTHEELLVDEVKRYILLCIQSNFVVQP